MSRIPPIRVVLICCLATLACACGGRERGAREDATFVRRVEAACTARAAGLRRVPAVRTRRAFLTSFPARRLVEQDFVRTVDAIVPPRAHKPGFKRLTAAAERRVDAADALNEAVLTRDVGAARAALSKSRSSSVVIEREAHTFGASCTA